MWVIDRGVLVASKEQRGEEKMIVLRKLTVERAIRTLAIQHELNGG